MTKILKQNTVLAEVATSSLVAQADAIEPPKLASWMVAKSYSKTSRKQGVEAFRAQFQDVDPEEARSWAYRFGWEKYHHAYKPLIDIGTIIITIMGFVLAIAGLLIA